MIVGRKLVKWMSLQTPVYQEHNGTVNSCSLNAVIAPRSDIYHLDLPDQTYSAEVSSLSAEPADQLWSLSALESVFLIFIWDLFWCGREPEHLEETTQHTGDKNVMVSLLAAFHFWAKHLSVVLSMGYTCGGAAAAHTSCWSWQTHQSSASSYLLWYLLQPFSS